MGKLSSGKSQFQIVTFYDEIYYKGKKKKFVPSDYRNRYRHTLLHSSVFIFYFKTRLVRVPTSKFILFILSLFYVIVNVVVFCL
jgi:hypothetical protein